jgi:tetratricopeptide (TPR) repeat protein
MSRLLVIIIISLCSPLWAQAPTVPAPLAPPNTKVASPVTRTNNFIVAESAFLNSDFFKAEYLYKEIIKDKIWDDEAFLSLDRLATIAQVNGDQKLFSDTINTTKDIKNSSNMAYYSLLYNLGKYLFHEGNYNLAIRFLDKVDVNSPYYIKVLYIKAACFVTAKKYKDAVIIFDHIIKAKDSDQDLRDLAVLGKARIFMITKRYYKALAEYQSISQWSQYYLDSLKETARVFLAIKDYDNAILHLETLAFVNSNLYVTDKKDKDTVTIETLTDFDLMNLKTIQGYIYMEQDRFEEASQIFNEIILSYNFIKRNFAEQIKRFKVSDDLTQLISHPTLDGKPRSLVTNANFVLFGTGDYYSTGFREWLTYQEKNDLIRYLNVYYSVLSRTENITPNKVLPDEVIRLIALRNLMNKYLKSYIDLLVKRINARLDDVGLRSQLGKIDITWKTKENQSKKIKEIQEQKQEFIDELDYKYKRLVE